MQNNTVTNQSIDQRNYVKVFSFFRMRKKSIVELISLFFVVLFVYTGVSKLIDFDIFNEQLAESPLKSVAPVIAWGLPIMEFIISVLLFFPTYRLKGLYATFVIMVLFTAYVIVVLTTSPELPCSCGGIVEYLSWQGHLIFNGLLILLAFAAIKMEKSIDHGDEIQEERFLTSHV